jgi:potassium efflux system protein
MSAWRALAVVLGLALAGPAVAQESGSETVAGPDAPTDLVGPPAPEAVVAGPDYAAWARTAERSEVIAESGRGSSFALVRLRTDLVIWRDRFLAEQAVNAARIGTVEAQIAALGPPPADGVAEDPRVAARRALLAGQLTRLQAPILLAEEAYAHANGLIGEVDRLIRARQTNELMTRQGSPLAPALWPDVASAIAARTTGLMKELTTSVRSTARQATLRENWPAVLLYLAIGGLLLARGRRWVRKLDTDLAQGDGRGAGVWRFFLGLGAIALPYAGLVALVAAVDTSGLFGFRASTVIWALPEAGLVVLVARWLAQQFFSPARINPAPFDFSDRRKAEGERLVYNLGWLLALSTMSLAFLATSEVSPQVEAAVYLPFELLLAWVLFRFGRLIARPVSVSAGEAASQSDAMLFRRRLLMFTGRATMVVSGLVPLLSVVGFSRASDALLFPLILTLALIGVVVLLQWLVFDTWTLLTRAENGARDALAPVLIGFVLILAALPLLALIWGARPEDLREVWARVQEGVAMGDSRITPGTFATLVAVFGVGFMITRLVQGTLRTTVLPKTRMDIGGQNAIVSGLGYVGIFLSALFAITSAGLDLSNLAIVAGALSVGIGFGLQTIVSNFVSGIILLVERPISEGDWIEVGGRMGYVRDISVRSTRIETFDRTDVIVPNADLVSGQVVNWTRGNSVGRVIAPVSVMFGTDPERVLAILRDVAEGHPMVLLSPPPSIVLQNFGPDVLNFEIRAIVRDVNFGLAIRSEMNLEIAKRFYAEGIEFAGAPRPNAAPNRTAMSEPAAPAAPAVVIVDRLPDGVRVVEVAPDPLADDAPPELQEPRR